jgi:Fic family protein
MKAAMDLSERIDANAILGMHRALMESTDPAAAGRWRSEQVWIGRSRIGPHDADFVPPASARVPDAIDDLVRFGQRDDVPVLTQTAIAHAQFETIHPFSDGNGRTGRALMQATLRSKALTRNVTVPVSAGLLTNTQTYFDALTAYRAGDPSQIVRRVSEAAFEAVRNGRALVSELREIRFGWNLRVTARRDSAVWRVCDLLMRQPVVDTRLLTRELGITANNVLRHVAVLESAEVLVEFTAQKRNRAWRTPEVLRALDDFATRAGWRVS